MPTGRTFCELDIGVLRSFDVAGAGKVMLLQIITRFRCFFFLKGHCNTSLLKILDIVILITTVLDILSLILYVSVVAASCSPVEMLAPGGGKCSRCIT